MWKCIGLLLFLGQWILVTSETNDFPGIHSTRNTECCPCSEGKSADLTASATTHDIDDCPCKARSADSESAASIFSPILRAVRPPSRQPQQKDLKPLLEPEVDLASSVLATLREATEEEYQEALARDAARDAVQDDINKFVKIVVNSETSLDDAEPEASNSHSVRCVDPLENNSFLGRSSLQYSRTNLPNIAHIPILGKTHDIDVAANNLHRTLVTPRSNKFSESLTYKGPLQQTNFKTPVYERNQFISPTDDINRFVQEYEPLPVSSFLPLGRNNLLKQLDLRNILNLDKVPSLVPSENMSERNIILQDSINHSLNNYHESLSDEAIAETKNCMTADNILNDSEHSVETKILNSIPTKSMNHIIQTKSSENTDLYEKDIKSDGTVKESRDNFNMLFSSDKNNYKFVSEPLDGEDEKTEQFSSQAKNMPLIKDSIIKTLDDFKEANAAMHEKFKSSLDNILPHSSTRMASNGDFNKPTNPDTPGSQVRNNNNEETGLSVKDIENNSNVMPVSNNNKYVTLKSSERDAYVPNKLDDQNKHNLNLLSNQGSDPTLVSDERSDDNERENTDTCLVYGNSQSKNADSDQNEMKMAASEPFNSRYGMTRMPESTTNKKAKNSLNMRTPSKIIEDINLDIFDFQPFSSDQVSKKNTIESLPRLNMNSYKTRVPIPQSLDLKPVKLQKAFRKGNDVLGAVLTIKPHSEERSNNMRPSQTRSSHNIFEHPLGMLPSFDDIRSFLEHNAKNILKLPHLSRKVGKDFKTDSPIQNIEDTAEHLRTYTEDALKNVQQSLGNTLHDVRDRERTLIGDAFLNPNGLVESLTGNSLNVNDKLHDLQANLNDRLQSIFDQSRSSSYVKSKNVPIQRKQARPVSRMPSIKDSNILHRKLNSKASLPSQKILENSRAQFPIRKIDKPITLENARLSKIFDSSPHRQKILQPKESKSIASLPSAKKATVLESLTNKNILPLFERKLVNPALSRNALPDRNFLTRNLIREQKFSPSESIYRSVPVEKSPKESLSPQNIDDKKLKTSVSPTPILKKTLLPNIAGNNFLAKVKEAVTKDNLRNLNVGHQSDVVPSPSETVRSAEPQKENLAFNCKMVCDRA